MTDKQYLDLRNSLDTLNYLGMHHAIFNENNFQIIKQKTIDSFGEWTGYLCNVKIISI